MTARKANTQTCMNGLVDICDKDKKVAIFMHRTPDPDAMGAAVGVQYVLKHKFDINSEIFFTGEISHRQNQTLTNVLSLTFSEASEYESKPEEYTAKICVDCLPQVTGVQLLVDTGVDLIIDHHRGKEPNDTVAEIRAVGACCSIVWDIMKSHNSLPDGDEAKVVATTMIMGIRTDTSDLLSASLTDLDHDAYRSLLPLADFQKVQQIINYPKAPYYYDLLSNAIENGSVAGTTFIFFVGLISESKRDVLPSIADEMVRREGVSTAVIFGIVNDHVNVSVRSENVALDVNAFCKRIFGESYSGGKYGAGGANIPLGLMSGIGNDPDNVKEIGVNFVKTKLTHLIEQEANSEA